MGKRPTILGVTEIVDDAYEAAKTAADRIIGGGKAAGPDFVVFFTGSSLELELTKHCGNGAGQAIREAKRRMSLGPIYAGYTVLVHGKTGLVLGAAIVVANPSRGDHEGFLADMLEYSALFSNRSPFLKKSPRPKRRPKP